MSVTKRTNAAGGASWDVWWRESGRGSRVGSRSFKTKREAHDVEGEIRRVQRIGRRAPVEASSHRLEDWLTAGFRFNRTIWPPAAANDASRLDR
jgi:hypothetical protein